MKHPCAYACVETEGGAHGTETMGGLQWKALPGTVQGK